VGGGIPIIQGLHEGLAANKIHKIFGILNGTTNYILTKMAEENMTFADALREARHAGFAEADPTYDLEGIDTAHKLAILSSIAFGGWVKISDVYTEGIAKLDLFDLKIAEKEFGLGLKLLGIAKEHQGKVEARVHPTFLPLSHPFLSVKNEYNAISIEGDVADDVMFYGKGAGQMAAASAVVSDIIFVARHIAEDTAGRLPYVTYDETRKINLLDLAHVRSKYYLRFTTEDRPGVLSKITGILGDDGVSIASVFQPPIKSKTVLIRIED
jgi:homoserine dehydrogenase